MTTNENLKPLDNHASGVEIETLDNHASGIEIKPLEKEPVPAVPAPGVPTAGDEIQTLDNHASGPRP
ncbi:hypothetical protein DEJ51_13980 [Streptomyces venezuelae]|uniref:Sigma-like protein n=1 Tax=Streptomyces venezuelae TaxID=54571 RepID=A0A5P2DJ26_STRVZ|nr:hypothetical protein [Streptomyces venezuelae]QES55165.1 hypothetical protein DEJ51_13980 [Streptomyces venezuelae]